MSDIPDWVKRLRFWLWDGQFDWLFEWRDGYMDKHHPRVVDAACSWQHRLIERPGLWLICRIWGHQPWSECADPNHDTCLTCQKSMPSTFVRQYHGKEPR